MDQWNIRGLWNQCKKWITYRKDNQNQQEKRFYSMVKFFGMMLLFTLISRGTAGAIMPSVTLVEVTSGMVGNEITLEGESLASNQLEIEALENIIIQEIYIQAGEQVEEGECLFTYESSDVDFITRKEQAEIEKLQVQYEQLLANETVDEQNVKEAQQNLAYALEDQTTSAIYGEELVKKSQEEVTLLTQQLEEKKMQYNQENNLLENAKSKWTEATKALERLEGEETTTEEELLQAQQQVIDSKNEMLQREDIVKNTSIEVESSSSALTNAKERLETAQADKKSNTIAHERNVTMAQNALERAEKSVKDQVLQIQKQQDSNEKEAEILAITLEERKAKLEKLLQLQETEYTVYALVEGTVLAWNIQEGEESLATAGIFTNNTEEYQYYDLCVPTAAIRQDTQGYFLYGIKEQDTILGIENVVQRIDIVILEMGSAMTAISGMVSLGDFIIIGSDKMVEKGDRVRIPI